MQELRCARWAASLALTVLIASPACLRAETGALRPGEYLTEGGWGVLTVSTSGDRTTHFSIEAVGGNGHTCSVDGEVRDLEASLDVDEAEPCKITFLPTAEGIEVSGVESTDCHRYFCGIRADFLGLYLKPAPGCGTKELQEARDQFKQLYTAKSCAKAAAKLEPLLSRCSRTLGWLETGWLRNDLAVTQYHLGRLADCRKTLEPLLDDASKTDDELREQFPPTDFESYLPIAKATRHNAKLCAQPKK